MASFYGTRRPHQSSQYAHREWIPAEGSSEVDDDNELVQGVTLGHDLYRNQEDDLFRQNSRPGTDPLCLTASWTLILFYC